VKERNKYFSHFNEMMKLGAGVERLISFLFFFIILNHIFGCFWYMISFLSTNVNESWVYRNNLQDEDNITVNIYIFNFSQIYVASYYWSLTTITTVGYGDISAHNIYER
jgi:hypothetical protein